MIRLAVRVQPRASKDEVCGWENQVLKVRVTAPAAEGAANEACLKVLAAWLGVPKSHLTILRGERSRNKLIAVANVDEESLRRRLEPL